MALILDETFATGIPGGFATLRSQSGTPTATYNATYGAVDLSNGAAAQSMWDITSSPLSVSGEMEAELEFVADLSGASNIRHAGLWVVAGNAAVSNGFRASHYISTPSNLNTNDWAVIAWTGGASWAGNAPSIHDTARETTIPFLALGDRRILNMRWDMTPDSAGKTKLTAEFRVDGKLVSYGVQSFASLRPGIFFYQCTVRLHSIKVWDAPQLPLGLLSNRGFATALGKRTCAPAEQLIPGSRVVNLARGLMVGQRNAYFGGAGRIAGTVKVTPNTPVHRRIRLFDEKTGLLVREAWSDEVTGAYSFDYVDMTRSYTVIGFDYTLNYRAVIADNLTPERIT